MLFRYSLTIPANTAESAPTTLSAPITYGVLRRVMVSFPPGCAGLAHVVCRYHGSQIVPVNIGSSLAWDAVTLSWEEEIPLFVPPFELDLLGWNEDDAYAHSVTFRFVILPPQMPQAGNLVQQLFGSLVPRRVS